MNRCTHRALFARHARPPRTPSAIGSIATEGRALHAPWLALALCAVAALAPAQSAVRSFPPKAERGVMQITQPPEMLLNGKPDRLSPGARIHGVDNLLLMSGTLQGQKAVVNLVREPAGQVSEVWILTEAEAALKLP